MSIEIDDCCVKHFDQYHGLRISSLLVDSVMKFDEPGTSWMDRIQLQSRWEDLPGEDGFAAPQRDGTNLDNQLIEQACIVKLCC
jgi:hypothetical protein